MTPRFVRHCLAVLVCSATFGLRAQTPAAAAAAPANPDDDLVSLKLPDADIDTVLTSLEALTGRTVLRPAALQTATYNFKTPKPMPKSEVVLALETVLALNNISVAPQGDKFLVVTLLQTARSYAPEMITGSAFDQPASGKTATKLFQLEFLRVNDVMTLSQGILNQQYLGFVPLLTANAALVTDSVSNLQRFELLLRSIDRPVSSGMTPKFYPLSNAKAADIVTRLHSIFTGTLQQQLGSAPPRFFLFARQPIAQRLNQVVVRQLVEAGGGWRVAGGEWRVVGGSHSRSFRSSALRKPLRMRLMRSDWLSRRDQADFAVEDANQVVEVPAAGGVARCFQQLGMRPHVAFDVGPRIREKAFENFPRCLLVITVFGGSGARTEGFFEKRDTDPGGAAHFLQGGRRPCFAFHHLGKQCQTHGDDLTFLSQARDGLFQEFLLVFGRFPPAFGKLAKGAPECRQNFSRVIQVEQINQRAVLPFDKPDFQFPEETTDGQPEVVPHHDEALHVLTVALPNGLHELTVEFFFPGVEPLLELIEDDQHFFAGRSALPAAQSGQRVFQ